MLKSVNNQGAKYNVSTSKSRPFVRRQARPGWVAIDFAELWRLEKYLFAFLRVNYGRMWLKLVFQSQLARMFIANKNGNISFVTRNLEGELAGNLPFRTLI